METHINALNADVDQAEVELAQAKNNLAVAKARVAERKAQAEPLVEQIEEPTPADNEALNDRAKGEPFDVRISKETTNGRRSKKS